MATATLDWVGPAGSGGDSSNITAKYWIDAAASLDEAIAAMLAAAPSQLGGLVVSAYEATPETDTLYFGSLTYATKKIDESSYSFEIGVQSTKITQSLQTVGSYALPGKTASNLGGAIGVTPDGVEGTEISVPTFSWTETHYLEKSRMNRSFFFTLFNLTAQMNSGTFRDFDPGEVLFLGVNGSASRLVPKFELQFKFIALPNATSLSVGGITISEKLGHDYLWVRYKESKDNASLRSTKIPFEVFVERVYQFGDYDQLRLPDPF